MKIAIVEDDIRMYECLKTYLYELLASSAECIYFPSGENFLKAWHAETFELIILDIFMDRLTGMDVAKEIRKTDQKVYLAFSTSSNEFASESYEVNACYYLHKPFGKEQIKAMLDRIDLVQLEKMRTVQLPDGTSIVLRDIIYVDYASHCTTVHCNDGRTISIRSNFSEIENLLSPYPYFFISSKGVIVNFYEVAAQNTDTFTMRDGSQLPISRRKAKNVKEAYSSFLFAQLREEGKE